MALISGSAIQSSANVERPPINSRTGHQTHFFLTKTSSPTPLRRRKVKNKPDESSRCDRVRQASGATLEREESHGALPGAVE